MVPTKRTNHPREGRMTALAFTTDPREAARILEKREAQRVGTIDMARTSLSRRLGCAPGTLETLRKGRLKRIEGWLQEKLQALLVREIEAELKRLTHELETYRRASGDASNSPQMARLVEAVAAAQNLIDSCKGAAK